MGLTSVATSGLAILMADLRILFWASVLWAVAVVVYLLMTGLIAWRPAHDSSAPELAQSDIWILMGGAAIATLAAITFTKPGWRLCGPRRW